MALSESKTGLAAAPSEAMTTSQNNVLLPEFEISILERLRVIEEFRLAKRQIEKNLEVL